MQAFSHFLSRSRFRLRAWSRHGINNIESEIKNVESDIQSFDCSDSDLNSPILTDLYSKLATLHRQSNSLWAQRAHMSWLLNGVKNSKFFHYITRSRTHFNLITQVATTDGVSVTSQPDILLAFYNFYSGLWNTHPDQVSNILELLPDNIPSLSDADSLFLIREVTKEEVYLTILDLPSGKSPGPDGFNIEFYRAFWPVIGDQFFLAVKYFFDNCFMPSSWGKTSITLIPKISCPKRVSDYRPISLCNVCFKIITKLLSNRLKLVLPKLIGLEQVGFISERCIFDNILATQEVVHTIEHDINGPSRMLIKLDIEKAYDTISWDAIFAVLNKMNFHSNWISWISTCLKSSSFSVIVNGVASPWFSSSRGVRQGDPISSHLFILVSQILTSLLNLALRNGKIPGFNSNLKHNFNHLMYADDLILITHASRSAARNIVQCLNFYYLLSGQRPNQAKSHIFSPLGSIRESKKAYALSSNFIQPPSPSNIWA